MEVAYRMQAARASDRRDHLYSILGLAHNVRGHASVPKYDLTFTVCDSCVWYARHFVRAKDNLEVLYWAGMNVQKLFAPSWVPNWYGGRDDFNFEHA